MRLLFVANADSPLVHNLALELKQLRPSLTIDVLSDVPPRSTDAERAFDAIIFPAGGGFLRRTRGLKFFWYIWQYARSLGRLPGGYDVVHVFYLSAIWGVLANRLKRKGTRMVITLFGSDVYRTYWPLSLLQCRLLDGADRFTSSNTHTLDVARKKFNRQLLPSVEILFGLRSLDVLNAMPEGTRDSARAGFGIGPGAIVIACGYNASRNQNHMAIFEAISRLSAEVRQRLYLLVPLTSGGTATYVEEIRDRLVAMGVAHRVFVARLNDEEVAMVRCSTDILVQVQSTDQLSGSMLEHLFAGSVLLTGAWLPYGQMAEQGLTYWTTASLQTLGADLQTCILELDARRAACVRNRQVVWGMTYWCNTAPQWSALYD